jgi:peptidoglycan/LPS O-acetylase OafA/YrhL
MDIKPSIKFLPQIDGLRFIAVMGVIISHWCIDNYKDNLILKVIPFGGGVQLFFVISGYLITKILLIEKERIGQNQISFWQAIKSFFLKRILRIFPIYYLLIAALIIIYKGSLESILTSLLTYTFNWHMLYAQHFFGDKTHLWSLSVEEQFYIIWPFLILLFPFKKMKWLMIIAIMIGYLSKLYYTFCTTNIFGAGISTFSCFDAFGLGGILAYSQIVGSTKLRTKTNKILFWCCLIFFYILSLTLVFINKSMNYSFVNCCVVITSFFSVAIASNGGFNGFLKIFLENRIVLYLGRISYGLYLYHNFIPTVYWKFIDPLPIFRFEKNPASIFIIYFILTLILASISWFLIERPILSLKRFLVK